MQVREIMTENPVSVTPDTNLQEVARLMLEHDCGLIPVVDNQENKKPVGTITDRDIAMRTVAAGQNPLDVKASHVMTMGVTTVTPETSVQECCDVMENKRIRRVLVVDHSGGVRGIVAQADVAEYGQSDLVSNMVEEISESSPTAHPKRSFGRRIGDQPYAAQRSSFEQPYATHRSSFRTENAPRRSENAQRFRSERQSSSTKKSSFGLKSVLPLLIGVGAGAAVNYYLLPDNKTKRRVTLRRDTPVTTLKTNTETNKTPIDLTNRPADRSIETKEIITGNVTSSSTQSNNLKTGADSTRDDDLKTTPGISRSAS